MLPFWNPWCLCIRSVRISPFFDDELPDRTQRLIWEIIEIHGQLTSEAVGLLGADDRDNLSVAEQHAATQAGLSTLIAAQLCRRSDRDAADALQDIGVRLVFKEASDPYHTALAAMAITEGVLRATSILGPTQEEEQVWAGLKPQSTSELTFI